MRLKNIEIAQRISGIAVVSSIAIPETVSLSSLRFQVSHNTTGDWGKVYSANSTTQKTLPCHEISTSGSQADCSTQSPLLVQQPAIHTGRHTSRTHKFSETASVTMHVWIAWCCSVYKRHFSHKTLLLTDSLTN